MFDFLSQKFSSLFSRLRGKGRLTQQNIDEVLTKVEEALFEADVPYDVVGTFISQMRTEASSSVVTKSSEPGHRLIKIIHDRLCALLSGDKKSASVSFTIPSVIMMVGLQGAGKTTTLAKIALWLKKQAEKRGKARRILCASLDFARPAAREQLRVLSEQVDIDYCDTQAQDPLQAAREVMTAFKSGGYEHLFVDTAGRLHVADDLMDELAAVKKIITPHYTALVLDTMTGQESLSVAQSFHEKIGFNGAILAKLDSDARGGSAIAFRTQIGVPIWFVGTGEKVGDLEQFIPERMVSRIIGMGDLATLLEKADDVIDKDRQEQMAQRMMSGAFTLEDFAAQIDMVGQMGALGKIMRYMPGASSISQETLEQGQRDMKVFRAIISSMTPKEKRLPMILDGSRKKRIAQGAGVEVSSVNQLLQKFEQNKQFAKMLRKAGGLGSLFRGK